MTVRGQPVSALVPGGSGGCVAATAGGTAGLLWARASEPGGTSKRQRENRGDAGRTTWSDTHTNDTLPRRWHRGCRPDALNTALLLARYYFYFFAGSTLTASARV